MDCVAFQVVAHLLTDLAFDRLTLRIFVALSSVLFELIQCRHDYSLAERAEVLSDWK